MFAFELAQQFGSVAKSICTSSDWNNETSCILSTKIKRISFEFIVQSFLFFRATNFMVDTNAAASVEIAIVLRNVKLFVVWILSRRYSSDIE